jgi:hypothetical protein
MSLEIIYHTQHNGRLKNQNKSAQALLLLLKIADIIKNRLRDNLKITIKEVRGLVKQKYPHSRIKL